MQTRIRRLSFLCFIVAAALALAPTRPAHAFDCGYESGSGVQKTETRNVSNFARIETAGAVTLEIAVGPSPTSVVISGDDNVVPRVKTTVSGGVLQIRTEGVHHTKLPMRVKIAMPKLLAIETSGASQINVVNISGERFELDSSGSTKAVIGGTVDKLVLRLSGAGEVDAGGLVAKDADIDGKGASSVEVNATDKLSVRISGASEVTYLGHPAITQNISGAGKIAAK
jgi:hypothetical protein